MPPLRTHPAKVLLWIALAVFAAVLLWLAFANTPSESTRPRLASVQWLGTAHALPDFSLRSAQGPLTRTQLQGHWTLVFLGFTHCPDICPTTLAELAQAEKHWLDLPETRRPRILFISADPERDTAELLARYTAHFSPHILSASHDDPATLRQLTDALQLVFAKVEQAQGYSIDHSGAVAVLDPHARRVGVIRPPFSPQHIGADLRLLSLESP